MDAGQLTTYAWLLPTWPNWQSPSKLLFPTCWHSWYTVSTSVLSQFLGMHAGKSGWFFYQLEIVLFTEFPDSLTLRMSPGVSPWESHSLGQVPMCWLHSSSSGHTMVLTNANCCPSCVKQFCYESGYWCLDMHMQVENGLVETVAVLISKTPRLRPSLPPGSPGQAHSFKPEFSRVRWSSTLSSMSASCMSL